MGLVDLNEPIDLLTFCNTAHYDCSIEDNHYGVNLTEEVRNLDVFAKF